MVEELLRLVYWKGPYLVFKTSRTHDFDSARHQGKGASNHFLRF